MRNKYKLVKEVERNTCNGCVCEVNETHYKRINFCEKTLKHLGGSCTVKIVVLNTKPKRKPISQNKGELILLFVVTLVLGLMSAMEILL